ncbi:ParB/RepB/Spo0J family partition protein [Desulforhabdus amnigena]|uniref:ParB-like N-terminal domain-containing protein n=1 Tax=Desulforhabdus amnigena TaxID=40218 RepID=A0A9W6L9D4_9BACT|nr:ParB/RepB/Spo0J family partition protein [Desulforhabdus amnigena]GLI36463.1 hypothetical protein DAMNIGENAA_38960 [Desulforhabdus amnigena]
MIAVAPTYQKGRLYTLDLSQLQPDPNQPRKSLDPAALEELAASIAQHGVLEPILFRLDENGGLIIVAGERRVQAARQANLTTIPGILVDGNHAEIALVENLLRQDLTAIEEAEALSSSGPHEAKLLELLNFIQTYQQVHPCRHTDTITL